MHLTVFCSDDPVRSVGEPVSDGVRRRHAPLGGQKFAQEMVGLYATIAVPELPETTDVDVSTDMPTLILIGGLDAATPTFRSAVVAKWLPRARLVVFPDGMQGS
jgi:pimeloyl-ACP methyl ester carboxylesterase